MAMSRFALHQDAAIGDIQRQTWWGLRGDVSVHDPAAVNQTHRRYRLRALKRQKTLAHHITHGTSALCGGFKSNPTSPMFLMEKGLVGSLSPWCDAAARRTASDTAAPPWWLSRVIRLVAADPYAGGHGVRLQRYIDQFGNALLAAPQSHVPDSGCAKSWP